MLNCHIGTLSFKGIAPEYSSRNGYTVIPIHKNPGEEQIKNAVIATKCQKQLGEGLNGNTFVIPGQDLVVKRYKGKKAISDDPRREFRILDKMYEGRFNLPQSQKGLYALRAPDGTFYLVSTKVEGENPNPLKDNFNKENLISLVSEITKLDQGGILEEGSERSRFMNWDFNGGNINITKDKAGLFDFEYGTFENLDEMIEKNIVNNAAGTCFHMSDTSKLNSSLRSFEVYTLVDYLKEIKNPDTLFADYLEVKSRYHANMAKFYNEKYIYETKFQYEVREIAKSEEVHSRLLKKDETGEIPKDIKKSEMMKMQAANFIHEQSQQNNAGKVYAKVNDGKVVTSQVEEYLKKGKAYFMDMLEKAKAEKDKDREIYYSNCLELFSSWDGVKYWLQYQIDMSQINEAIGPGFIHDKFIEEPQQTLDDILAA